ncbi:MAG: Hsp70 family protein [Lachnospiraceae bacterium]|nr:Hsp70 family protein [Lachnospiraceae bacterium]
MFTCGIDFGSTYTTVSVFREDSRILEAVILSQDSPYIPTVVASRPHGKGLIFGRAAKSGTGKPGVIMFKAFKMLLAETDPEILSKRGFTDQYTPVEVTKAFLNDLADRVLESFGEEKIDKVVIGAPEIWFKEVKTIAGRSILRDICAEIPAIKTVQVVSEPAAASAFFAYNFNVLTGRAFEGNILLIDYGGGTLDISLTTVIADGEDGAHRFMRIKVIESNGAGENTDRHIGKAGIVYMESVMEEAIRRAGLLGEDEELVTDGKFYKAVNDLEEELKDRTDAISDMFSDCGIDDLDELDEEFTSVSYKGEYVEITYALLVEVYNQVIRDVFEEKLKEMTGFMEKHGIDYMDRTQDNFKIALVGGFGNFYLVKKQMMDVFKFIARDRRQQNIIRNKADCEKAISLGTALLASGEIGIRQTAPYSVGIFEMDMDGNPCLDYAFRYKEDIEFNKAYYPVNSADGQMIITFFASNAISSFVINMGHDERTAIVVPLKEEFKQRLQNIVNNEYRTAVVGFSLDSSEVLSIHIREYNLLEGKMGEDDRVIELSRFGELFEMAKVEKVISK